MILLGCIFTILAAFAQANADGHCVMRGFCDTDNVTLLNKPCVYNGRAVPLYDAEAKRKLNDLCPNLKTGPDFAVCCDAKQVDEFEMQMSALAALFKRCPSCYYNLANLFCQQICSANQSLFMEVTASTNKTVDEINYYITEQYATGLFESCKNVKLASTSHRAIEISCGIHSEDCTPHLWLEYMGSHDPSPFQINFRFQTSDVISIKNDVFYPMNEKIIPCSQAVNPGDAACSCVDCPSNC